MNTKERAFNLIAKTQQHLEKQELSSEKVELALDAEIKRAENIVNSMISTAKAFEKEMASAQRKINDIIFMLDTGNLDKAFLNPAKQIKKEIEKAGLTDLKIYTDLKNWTPLFEATIKSAQDMESKLKQIS